MVIGGIAANGEGIIETNQIGSCQPQQYLRKCNDFMQFLSVSTLFDAGCSFRTCGKCLSNMEIIPL